MQLKRPLRLTIFPGGQPDLVGVPLPDVEERILDADDGHAPLTAGQIEEIRKLLVDKATDFLYLRSKSNLLSLERTLG